MDPDNDEELSDYEEGIVNDWKKFAETSLLLEDNHHELVELTITYGVHYPPDGYQWWKTGESIAHNTHLKRLTLHGIARAIVRDEDATEEDLKLFFEGVAQNVSIRTLCLSRVLLGDELFNVLLPFFTYNRYNRKFETLHFVHCAEERTHLIASVLSQFTSLKEFAFGGPSNGSLQPVIDALSAHSGLGKLDLRGTHMGEDAFAALAALLQKTKSNLFSLALPSAGINDKKAATLATSLTSNSTLRQLNIDSNPDITETGWIAIFAALCDNSCRIEQLDVSNNCIGDPAAHSLADLLLTTNKSLQRLTISTNQQITMVGWRAIFVALQSPACVLTRLSVANNILSGAKAVLPAVLANTNSSLEKLDLSNTLIDDVTAVALADALVSNDTLTELILDNNEDITIQRSSADNEDITLRGLSAFLRALCNPLNIMSTFQSNHTLRRFLHGTSSSYLFTSNRIQSLVCLNRENSKSEAARLKIIETHFSGPKGFAVEPFVDMDLAVLPCAIAWMSRHSVSSRIDEEDSVGEEIDKHLYGFLRNTKAWLAGVGAEVNREVKKQKTQR